MNTYFDNKGREVDQFGRIKYISPTGIVSWYFETDLPTKAGYSKGEQTREHRQRRSESQRTSPVWDHYDELKVYWKQLDMPSSYEFAKVARIKFSHVDDIKNFRFDNMVKWFREDLEEELDLSNLLAQSEREMMKYGYDKDEIVEMVQPKKGFWWEDDVEDCYTEDATFGRVYY